MIEHSRSLPPGYTPEQLAATEAHVRDHVASIADADDDPTTHADDVVVVQRPEADGGLTVVGFLAAEPDAPYLRPDHDHDTRPDWLVWTPDDQPGWDPYLADNDAELPVASGEEDRL